MLPSLKEEGLFARAHVLLMHYIKKKYTEDLFGTREMICQFILLFYWLSARATHGRIYRAELI